MLTPPPPEEQVEVAREGATTEPSDLWLEEIEGERALSWARERNAESLGLLQADARYAELRDAAHAILTADDRIPSPIFAGANIRNFWQDATHVRGVVRETTLASYRTPSPRWQTLLDVDALAEAEGKNWVYKGMSCLRPEERFCLVSLSDGGKDATTIREFDTRTRTFVEGGFSFEESKGGATWIDRDTLLASRDFGEGSMTQAGYPRTVRRLSRGQRMEDGAEVFAGEVTDAFIQTYALRDPDGRVRGVLFGRSLTFHEHEFYLLQDSGAPVRLSLPRKAQFEAFVAGQVVFRTAEDWTSPDGVALQSGDVFSQALDDVRRGAPRTELVIHPGDRDSIELVWNTRSRLLVVAYENLRAAVYTYARARNAWSRSRVPLPADATLRVDAVSSTDDRFFVGASGYLEPPSLYLADAARGRAERVKSTPPKFDGAGLMVERLEATSADGTLVPFTVVRRSDAPLDGSTPTLLHGYGGFEISLLPYYAATVGKLWLERGAAYAVANTRGGGEFGPRWHQAALRENRQRAHEDFQAVAMALIERGITSPRRLGVIGGSQGGLFMSVMLTQRPDLIHAAVINVPLVDMLRFHRLLAGASWVAEYGDPERAEDRAWLERYSPYQQFRAGRNYPMPFITTSTKDDRVHPGHARRAAHRLMELGYPVLYYENTDGGHGGAANSNERARLLGLQYTYLARRLID